MAEGKTIALLVAAGSGVRAGAGTPKQYRRLAGRSVLSHALRHLRHDSIDEVKVVIGAGQEALFAEAAGAGSLPAFVIGGATRQQSVLNGLEAIASDGGARHVLIHDAARPFVPPSVIDRLIHALREAEAAVPVLPVTDTVAFAAADLGDKVDRDAIVRVQTPQAFHFRSILQAHRELRSQGATDDAQLARAAGMQVAVVAGDIALDKLTEEADLARAGKLIEAALVTRIGMGIDVHGFTSGSEVRLGGIAIGHDKALEGHSDADVVLHAITDALLGAAGEGDIGDHFPPSDARWRGAASALFVEHARGLIEERGGSIDHVDVTIICEAPKISPHRAAMRQSVAALLRVPQGRISIKATTTEQLGFLGRGEGIAAQAVASVRLPE